MTTDQRKTGTIARLVPARVFGFIHCPADERDYFFHQVHLENCTFGQLAEGNEVTFVVGTGPKGIEAQEVRREDHVPIQAVRTPATAPEYKPKRRGRP